jgi:hypothetical protein
MVLQSKSGVPDVPKAITTEPMDVPPEKWLTSKELLWFGFPKRRQINWIKPRHVVKRFFEE